MVPAVAVVTGLALAPSALGSPDPDVALGDANAATAQTLGRAAPLAVGPGVDEIVSSPNLRQIANVPSGFAEATSVGTDIAFQGKYAYVGDYDGFTVYDISRPASPRVTSQVLCPGSQNDISVSGNLLFLSTDSSRSNDSCTSVSQSATNPASWEGIKIFDISNPAAPRYVKAVETDCGSHTHTLVPDNRSRDVYLYVSSYSPSDTFPDCKTPHDKVSIVKVPVRAPQNASVVAEPVLFPDGGNPGVPGTPIRATTGCHDITVYPQKNLAAGACMGDGVLMDITDRANPRVIERVRDEINFSFWHSATFSNNGNKVIFTDELGGGSAATCNDVIGPNRGANGIYDITGRGDDRSLTFRSYYKIPRPQTATENCVAHNGSLIPVLGRDIMVQSWYQGGVSVWDFTDSSRPREIGYWERGPLPDGGGGGTWSAYWYNGHIYSSDMVKGFDVLQMNDPRILTAYLTRTSELNVQTQGGYLGSNFPFYPR